MLRWLVVVVTLTTAACATTSRQCPLGSRLANDDRPTGRVEWCATTAAGVAALPVEGRTYPSLFDTAHPSPLSGGVQGPYTHWYPNGAVESHGDYIASGASSVPDGLWGFWYPNGSLKTIGWYKRGQPVGCFAVWDEHGGGVTGVVDGDQLRVEPCDPPPGDALAQVEARSHPRDSRPLWGDISLFALAQSGSLGISDRAQTYSNPSAGTTTELEIRKYLGSFRVGPVLGLRLSDTDGDRAYMFGAVAAYAVPLPFDRVGAEVEAQLSMQYFDLTARREGFPVSSVGFWAPLGGVRLALSFAVTPTVLVVGGASLDGATSYTTDQGVSYYLGVPPTMETWTVGGAAYGLDLGLRLRLR